MNNLAPFSMHLLCSQFRSYGCLIVGTCMALQFRSGTGQPLYLFLVVPASLPKIDDTLVPVQKGLLVLVCVLCTEGLVTFLSVSPECLGIIHFVTVLSALWTSLNKLQLRYSHLKSWHILAFPDLALQLFLKNNFPFLFDTS